MQKYPKTCVRCAEPFEGYAIRRYCTLRCQRAESVQRRFGRGEVPVDPVKSIVGKIAMAVRYRRADEEMLLRAQLAEWHVRRNLDAE